MRHVGVLPFPIGWLHKFVCLSQTSFCIDPTCESLMECSFNLLVLGIKDISIFIIRHFVVVHKEVNASGEEVGCRLLEEVITTAASLLSFLQRFYQSLGCFHCSSQVADVLLLNRIYSSGILYIDEVNNVELTVRRSVSGSLVLPVMVIELGC